MAAEDVQITCKFYTKLPAELKAPETAVTVPAKLTRYGLSQVVNHLLGLDPPKAFDFLVNGELVRLSLEQLLLANSVSAEAVLEVEYFLAVVPPDAQQTLPHDDWVSAVDGSRADALVSGSYDGMLRIWTGAGACISSVRAHRGPVHAVAALPRAHGAALLSAGKDHIIRLMRAPGLDAAASRTNPAHQANEAAPPMEPLEVAAVYRGHTDAVESLAPSPAGDLCASGSWDASIRVWRTGTAVLDASEDAAAGAAEAPPLSRSAKKRKAAVDGGDDAMAVPAAPLEEAARATLAGHSQCVATVAWPSPGVLYSGSWDHSVRRWDVGSGANTDTLNASKAVYCVAAPPEGAGAGLVAFGGAERVLRLWDPRTAPGEALAKRGFTSHGDWITAAAWHPTSAHHLATASFDCSAKLWDLRALVPLHTLAAHTDKALAVSWAGPARLASGGADCALRTFGVSL
ncbi:hypothetical protein WJX81_002702 [Elliptochloris bilobata]|uniref:Ribosome biogenesis protein WDR12 homolog n=1 Tax=Elliptochloris bilobata TaxID=381761 RepID=A0AAW1QK31_9CHLO